MNPDHVWQGVLFGWYTYRLRAPYEIMYTKQLVINMDS